MSIALPEGQTDDGGLAVSNNQPRRTIGSIAMANGFTVMPQTMGEAWGLVEKIAMSSLVPDALRGKPADIFMAISLGSSVGLDWAQSMQGIAVIGKRAALWGDHMLAVVQSSPVYGSHREWSEGSGESLTYWCEATRKGDADPGTASFSVEDARIAGLWGKQGPWTQYPKRMLQMRARAFALRDKFADVLKGIGMAEEVRDIPAEPTNVTPLASVGTKADQARAALEARTRPAPPKPPAVPVPEEVAQDEAPALDLAPPAEDVPPPVAEKPPVAKPPAEMTKSPVPVPSFLRNAIDSVAAELGVPPPVAADIERVTLNGQAMTAKLSERVIRALRDVAEGAK